MLNVAVPNYVRFARNHHLPSVSDGLVLVWMSGISPALIALLGMLWIIQLGL